MSDTPLRDASLEALPKNELRVEGGITKEDGGEIAVSLEREAGDVAGGLQATVSQKKGWGVSGYIKWILGK